MDDPPYARSGREDSRSVATISGRRRAAAGFEDLLHAAPEALLVVGADGVVIEANRRAEQAFRAGAGSLAGRGAGDLLPAYPTLPPDMIEAGAEVVARRADGSGVSAGISGVPLLAG